MGASTPINNAGSVKTSLLSNSALGKCENSLLICGNAGATIAPAITVRVLPISKVDFLNLIFLYSINDEGLMIILQLVGVHMAIEAVNRLMASSPIVGVIPGQQIVFLSKFPQF
jgi:hypothetical protein